MTHKQNIFPHHPHVITARLTVFALVSFSCRKQPRRCSRVRKRSNSHELPSRRCVALLRPPIGTAHGPPSLADRTVPIEQPAG